MDSSASFCEALGKKPFDWNEFLEKAISKSISEEEYNKACKLSGSWVTCAVGNQCAIIPRDLRSPMPAPIDDQLGFLGGIFHCCIVDREYLEARHILGKIEIRSAQIISQIRKEVVNG